MKTKLSARDQEKLDQYLTGVRELEVRIQKAERLGLPRARVEGVAGFGVAPPDALWRAVRSASEVVRKKSS